MVVMDEQTRTKTIFVLDSRTGVQNLGNCVIKTLEQGREINSIWGPNIALIFEAFRRKRTFFHEKYTIF